jgi:hypothetical protein
VTPPGAGRTILARGWLDPALRWLVLARSGPMKAAAAIATAGGIALSLAPAHAFLDIATLEFVQAPASLPFVIQRGRFRLAGRIAVRYAMELREIRVDRSQSGASGVRCTASGVWIVTTDPFGEMLVPLTGADGGPCRLRRGLAYQASSTWRFSVLGLTKIAKQRTGALVIPAVPVAVNPMLPPGL